MSALLGRAFLIAALAVLGWSCPARFEREHSGPRGRRSIGVGFGEEIIGRGTLIVALRSRLAEATVWLIGTLAFSTLHFPALFFGGNPVRCPSVIGRAGHTVPQLTLAALHGPGNTEDLTPRPLETEDLIPRPLARPV